MRCGGLGYEEYPIGAGSTPRSRAEEKSEKKSTMYSTTILEVFEHFCDFFSRMVIDSSNLIFAPYFYQKVESGYNTQIGAIDGHFQDKNDKIKHHFLNCE